MDATNKNCVRIGVDVGGTNTDAVAIDPSQQLTPSRGVLAHHKTPTTTNVTLGIESAVRSVLIKSNVPAGKIASVTIGTTHFLNALLEQDTRRLRRVAILRLSKSFLREVPPFSEFPAGLTEIIRGYVGYVDGGLHIDGSEEAPVREEQVVERCGEIRRLGLKAVVIVGVFSPIDEEFKQEDRVREIVKRELPGVDVIVSHEVANIGLIERENAAILNAAILKYAKRTVQGFRRAMKALKLTCPLFLTQNDGTLLDSAAAAEIPIRTFSSGATNSMRGAAYLSGLEGGKSSAIVVDIGGTTTDVGVLLPSGLPRQASAYVTVAGVRVNYSMPHLHSIGLGGGSIVREADDKVTVGPDSVGHDLTKDALVFGGKVVTSSDIAVAAQQVKMGNVEAVQNLSPHLVELAQQRIKFQLERAIDAVKTSPDSLPVILVGGGAVLAPASLRGASEQKLPLYHDVANAVGAAISKVGGVVDMIQSITDQTEAQAVESAKSLAIERAVAAGAIKETVIVAEVESFPVSYMANQLRVIVKAVGELDIDTKTAQVDDEASDASEADENPEPSKDFSIKVIESPPVDPHTYTPTILPSPSTGIQEWWITETDLSYLADGCYVLGCAGGGSPIATRLQLRDMLRAGHKMRVVDFDALPDSATVYWGGHMGSPATSTERLQSIETVHATNRLMEHLQHTSFDATLALEIGGGNGLEPFLVGSTRFFDRPVLDADFMGRAYPTLWQTTLAVHEPDALVPCAFDSGAGTTLLMTRSATDELVDRALRAACAEMGSRVGTAVRPTDVGTVRRCGVRGTVSLAWRIGRCIARAAGARVAEAIVAEVGGEQSAKILFRGKIVGVERRLVKGHSYGRVVIAGLARGEEEDEGEEDGAVAVGHMRAVAEGGVLSIPFKNENIYAEHKPAGEDGITTCLASVPDLICVLDTSSGRSLGVPEYKYGLRATVLGITGSPLWTESAAGLAIGGPRAFGFDMEYTPVGKYVEPRSVIKEYAAAGRQDGQI